MATNLRLTLTWLFKIKLMRCHKNRRKLSLRRTLWEAMAPGFILLISISLPTSMSIPTMPQTKRTTKATIMVKIKTMHQVSK
jgi:hypothetical protein